MRRMKKYWGFQWSFFKYTLAAPSATLTGISADGNLELFQIPTGSQASKAYIQHASNGAFYIKIAEANINIYLSQWFITATAGPKCVIPSFSHWFIMAPSVAQLAPETVDPIKVAKENIKAQEIKVDNVCITFHTLLYFSKIDCWCQGPLYPFYYPYFDLNEKQPPLKPFGMFLSYFRLPDFELITLLLDHVDPGTRADPKKPHLLNPNVTTRNISPYLGTEICGVQISELTKEGLDELALLAAERKVLIFRDQDFKDIGPDRQIEMAKSVFSLSFWLLSPFWRQCVRHFGPIHSQPVSGNVKGYPEFHIGGSVFVLNSVAAESNIYPPVYRDPANDRLKTYSGNDRTSNLSWHSDVSCEIQPPGTTFLCMLEQVIILQIALLDNLIHLTQ